jgi:hypothetical protein
MKPIDPIYVVEARKWFHGEVSAPTIRALLEKLGKGYRVNNYYPLGAEVRHSGNTAIVKPLPPPTPKAPPIFVVKAASRRSGLRHFRWGEIRDEVLDLWAAGVSTRMIAERFNISMVNVSAHIVAPARNNGDPRAAVRLAAGIGKKKSKI